MKRFIGLALIINVLFFMAGCNTPGDDTTIGEVGEEETIEVNNTFKETDFSGTGFVGFEISLTGKGLADISQYVSVTVDATLYSAYTDETNNTIATVPAGDEKNLAQFKVLNTNASGGDKWDNVNGICGGSKGTSYNMKVDGPSVWTVPEDAEGIPAALLIQANQTDFNAQTGMVVAIKVKTITFTPKTSDVRFEEMYNNGDYMDITGGNTITFKHAEGKNCAAVYLFPSSWGGTETDHTALANRTITFNYTIPEHPCDPSKALPDGETAIHQIRIQAAHSKEDKYNGADGQEAGAGQKYRDLNIGNDSFTILANNLITASQSGGTGTPFVLNAVRITNDGTTWNDGSKDHIRCMSYSIIFNSITISP